MTLSSRLIPIAIAALLCACGGSTPPPAAVAPSQELQLADVMEAPLQEPPMLESSEQRDSSASIDKDPDEHQRSATLGASLQQRPGDNPGKRPGDLDTAEPPEQLGGPGAEGHPEPVFSEPTAESPNPSPEAPPRS